MNSLGIFFETSGLIIALGGLVIAFLQYRDSKSKHKGDAETLSASRAKAATGHGNADVRDPDFPTDLKLCLYRRGDRTVIEPVVSLYDRFKYFFLNFALIWLVVIFAAALYRDLSQQIIPYDAPQSIASLSIVPATLASLPFWKVIVRIDFRRRAYWLVTPVGLLFKWKFPAQASVDIYNAQGSFMAELRLGEFCLVQRRLRTGENTDDLHRFCQQINAMMTDGGPAPND